MPCLPQTPFTGYRGKRPMIVWGDPTKTITFRYPLDNARAYPEPRPGSVVKQFPSGAIDAWTVGTYWLLAGEAMWIPSTGTPGVETGWEDAGGWRAFLEFAWAGGIFTFFPDATDLTSGFPALLVSPETDSRDWLVPEPDFTRRIPLVIARAGGEQVAGYQPAYRARIYKPRSQNDAAESQLLVPTAAGAPHGDVFAVSTLPTFTDLTGVTYQPYLDLPDNERRSEFDLLDKGVDKGSITLRFLDARLAPTSNVERWVSAFGPLLGCRVEVDRSLDGGASWSRWWTGRARGDEVEDIVVRGLDVRDMSEDWEQDIFVGPPAPQVTAGFQAHLAPARLMQAYGPFTTWNEVDASWQVQNFDGLTGFIDCRNSIGSHDNTITKVLADLASARYSSGYSTSLARRFLRFDYEPTPLGEIAYIKVGAALYPLRRLYAPAPWSSTDEVWRIIVAYGEGMEADFVDGQACDFTIVPGPGAGGAQPNLPIYLNDVHIGQVIEWVCKGYFGYLDWSTPAAPTPLWAIPYDTAAVAALQADQTLPNGHFVITKRAQPVEWLREACAAYGIGFYVDAFGELVPVDTRLSVATPSLTLTDDDLIAEDGAVEWGHSVSDAITRVTAEFYQDEEGDENDENAGALGEFPDIPPTRISTQALEVMLVDNAGGARDLGDCHHELKAPAFRCFSDLSYETVKRRFGLPVIGPVWTEVGRRYVEAALLRLMREIIAPFRRGARPVAFLVRDTTTTQQLQIGTWFYTDIAQLVNQDAGVRGGTRLCICTGREDDEYEVRIHAVDVSDGTAAAVPTIGDPFRIGGDDTKHRQRLDVTQNAAGDDVQVEWIATDASVGVRPADSDPGWQLAAMVRTTSVLRYDRLPSGKRIWWRARSVGSLTSVTALPSAWVYPPGAGYLDNTAITPPTAGAVAFGAFASVSLPWTNGDANYPTEVLQNYGAAPAMWTSAYRYALAQAGQASIGWKDADLTDGATVVVALRHIDPYGGASAVSVVTFVAPGTAAAPRMAGIALSASPAGSAPTGSGALYGAVITAFPSDPALDIQLGRAPDSAGAPDLTNITVITFPPSSGPVALVDAVAPDGATWWWAVRHGGPTPGPWTCWKDGSAMVVPTPAAAQPAALPTVTEDTSASTASTGQLDFDVVDPQCRVTDVEVQTQSGTAAPSAWSSLGTSGGSYSQTVPLAANAQSAVTYRISGYDLNGVLGVLLQRTVTFGSGTGGGVQPPRLTAHFDPATGDLTVQADTDALAVTVKIAAASGVAIPTLATIRAATPLTVTSQTVTSGVLLAGVAVGASVGIGAFAYDANGAESQVAQLVAVRPSTSSSGAGDGSPLHGVGAPASGLGKDGDEYTDDATGKVYLKSGGTWGQRVDYPLQGEHDALDARVAALEAIVPGAAWNDDLPSVYGDGVNAISATDPALEYWVNRDGDYDAWTISGDTSGGAAVFKIEMASYLSYPSFTEMTSVGERPTLTSGTHSGLKNQNTNLATTIVVRGLTCIRITPVSAASHKRVSISLHGVRV